MAFRFFVIISFVLPLSALSQRHNQGNHIVKMNLPAIFINNYSFQYEYVVSRKISLALNTRLMPVSKIPFQSAFTQDVNVDDPSINNTLDLLRLSNVAVTPELRYYFSKKGYGQGFYVAPFFRYARYKIDDLQFEFDDTELDTTYMIKLGGDLKTQTFGLLLGAQWNLGKHIVLDWWILGPQFGSSRGSITGNTDFTMDASLQQSLRQEMDKVEIPFTKKEVTVTNNSAALDLTGPWAGIRAGILLGIRF
jgi:hypothetical protein